MHNGIINDYVEIKKTGGFIIYGRSDTTLNPGGVRLGTAEIYSEVDKFEEIKESIVVGQAWDNDIRIILFIVLNKGFKLNEKLLQSDYIQADETTLQVLNEDNRTAKQKSYIWVRGTTVNNKIVLMNYSATRAKANANTIFEGFNSGYLQTDGYAGYNDIANKPEIEQLGCWAHIRRKFTDTVKNSKVDDKSKNSIR